MKKEGSKEVFCALILAGGKGTRFWPKSTEEKPKQFIKLIGDKTMIQMTFERMSNVIPRDKIFIITSSQYTNLVRDQLPDLPRKNIIIEPEARNTAPCILLAMFHIKQIYENANIAVVPSDHIIEHSEEFYHILNLANNYLHENKESIVTIGIKPNRPETGYGYIRYSDIKVKREDKEVIKVDKFVEKPNLNKAKEYLNVGNYLWNSGMFIFNVDYILIEYKKNLNKEFALLSEVDYDNGFYIEELYPKYKICRPISIDFAIMEKSESIYVIPSDFGWDDIGNWKALQRYINKDGNYNFVKSDNDVIASNSYNNIIYADGKKIILLDVNDMFCIDSEDVIIIGKKEELEKVHTYRNMVLK